MEENCLGGNLVDVLYYAKYIRYDDDFVAFCDIAIMVNIFKVDNCCLAVAFINKSHAVLADVSDRAFLSAVVLYQRRRDTDGCKRYREHEASNQFAAFALRSSFL